MDSDPAITIARATEADATALADFGRLTFEETFGRYNTPADMADFLSKTFGVAQQTAELRDGGRAMIVAKDERGAIVGYALLKRDSVEHCVTAERPSEVQRIYVDASLHGRDVGAQLMTECIVQSRRWGCDAVWLGVWEHNPRAIAFYEKQGFRTVGTHEFMLGGDRQRDYVMLKPLD